MKIVILLSFLMIIALPSFQNATGLFDIKYVEEYRKKADFPELKIIDLVMDRGSFGRKLLYWYDDRYGLRDILIRMKTQIDYSVFSKSDRIHIGHDGWLYYRNVLDNQKVQVERQPTQSIKEYHMKLRELSRNLASRGITLVVLRMPLKDIIYPEFMPKTVPVYPSKRNEFLASELIANDPDIISLDVTAFLKKLKPSLQIFHKTDFHWTDPAGFCCGRELVNLLYHLEGFHGILWTHELKISLQNFSGGQARFMPLLFGLNEMSVFVEKTWTDLAQYKKGMGPFREIYSTQNGYDRFLLPTTVVKGNSFLTQCYVLEYRIISRNCTYVIATYLFLMFLISCRRTASIL